MDDLLSGEALRAHLQHCDGCPDCAHVAADGRPYWGDHPERAAKERMDRHFGEQAFGPGEDYEGRGAT